MLLYNGDDRSRHKGKNPLGAAFNDDPNDVFAPQKYAERLNLKDVEEKYLEKKDQT
ncbi:predicted protein [Sclerotinia sclerotiorum 1980 UF-70]|uniref:Uncharacterized protein n=1 Tax=Sclerotinia sclerotiorum (strain ATCC 18683 / 1980 / Ss-1) TaxID=665079 RepID=A7EFU4_SCLS1|nr:predicted protein [Sclerotinia sclerotiorum 1980 UF-70]EDO01710.1 predicted protein [Sclerotinia sclerotiorum 1980 UF-70]